MILLVTSSSKHKHILQQIGLREGVDFTVEVRGVQEEYPARLSLPGALDKGKVRALQNIQRFIESMGTENLALQFSETVIASTETIILCDDKVLNMPALFGPAIVEEEQRVCGTWRETLSRIRGRELEFVSVLCLAQADNIDTHIFLDRVTRVWMKSYTDDDIQRYLDYRGELVGNVAPFAIDGKGVAFIDSIDGSYTSVLGLPIEELYEGLQSDICKGRVSLPVEISRWELPVRERGYPLRIVTVGDIDLELTFGGEIKTEVGFPRQLIQELSGEIDRHVGGDAALFALYARRVGFPEVGVLGSIGDDLFGQEIVRQLSKDGVNVNMINRKSGYSSSLALRLQQPGAELPPLRIIDSRSTITVRDVELAEGYIRKANLLFVSSRCLDDGQRVGVRHALRLAHQAGVKTLLYLPYGIERNISFDQFCQDVKTRVTILVMYHSTMRHWLGVQSEVKTLPKALHELCQALIVCSTDAKKNLLLFTDKRRLELSRPNDNGRAQTHFDMIQPIVSLLYQLMAPRLLLASRSPRRVQLLRQIMAPNRLEIFPSGVKEEERSPEEPIEEYLKGNALKKARAVRNRGGFSPHVRVILGADTNVVLDGRTIGQPLSDEEARSMLMQLNGKTHHIMTGVALIDTQTSHAVTDCVTTEVRMREMTLEEVESYIKTQEPIGKAGGYGIQGLGAKLVESIKGSYSNVVGLPLERVIEMLQKDLGLSIWDMDPVNIWQILSG